MVLLAQNSHRSAGEKHSFYAGLRKCRLLKMHQKRAKPPIQGVLGLNVLMGIMSGGVCSVGIKGQAVGHPSMGRVDTGAPLV